MVNLHFHSDIVKSFLRQERFCWVKQVYEEKLLGTAGTLKRNYPFLKNNNHKITIPKDYYFVLSDNRRVGLDSRKFGLIHKDNFSGIAFK